MRLRRRIRALESTMVNRGTGNRGSNERGRANDAAHSLEAATQASLPLPRLAKLLFSYNLFAQHSGF